jgi:hypothetical protein
MDDFERYGDYDEIEEENPPAGNPVSLILKIVCTVLIVVVVGTIGIRMHTFNHYPKEMKVLYFNETLTAYYNDNGGQLSALTQKLRAPYDNPNEGNFFADHLIVIPEIDQLQICMRYNVSVADTLTGKYGLSAFDADNSAQFSFSLWRSGDDAGYETGRLSVCFWDSYAMYRYTKLVFDDVDFDGAGWIRLEIFVEGIEEPFMIPIYENSESYSKFEDYKLGKGEKP